MASGTYVLNDLLDLPADRGHPQKRHRPFASGELSIAQGLGLAGILLLTGLGIAASLGWGVLACCVAYLVITLAYSFSLKQKPILDVVVLAFLYTLRLIVGGVAARVYLSPWLFQFSIFLFLSLAFVKRYSELHRLQLSSKDTRARGYDQVDLGTVSQAGIASGFLAGLVLALYVNSPDVLKLYPRPYVLWAACPLFIYWISRVWLITRRGDMDEDPVLFAFRDPVSYIVAAAVAALVLVGSIG
jgi:4-hydroxybenzoate polyprenyltransferase